MWGLQVGACARPKAVPLLQRAATSRIQPYTFTQACKLHKLNISQAPRATRPADTDADAVQENRAAALKAEGMQYLEAYIQAQARHHASAAETGPAKLSAEDQQRVDIIMSFLAAGEKIEEAIVSHRKDIDEPLIKILEDRYRTAVQLEENSETATGIKLLITRLRVEMERANAPPELRLLDDVLTLLVPSEGLQPADEASARAAREREERDRDALAVLAVLGATESGDAFASTRLRRRAAAAQRLREAWGLAVRGGDLMALSKSLDTGSGEELASEVSHPVAFLEAARGLEERACRELEELELRLEDAQSANADEQTRARKDAGSGGGRLDQPWPEPDGDTIRLVCDMRRAAVAALREAVALGKEVLRSAART